MLIARPQGSQFQVVDSFSKPVQLGTGLEASGRLSRPSMARTVHALQVCRRKLEAHQVARMRLVATEGLSARRNSRDFLRMIRRETGLPLEVINAEEEAQLAVISCAPLVSQRTEQLLVVDIGGGSTELVWTTLRMSSPPNVRAIMRLGDGFTCPQPGGARVVDWISVPLGSPAARPVRGCRGRSGPFALMSRHFEEML